MLGCLWVAAITTQKSQINSCNTWLQIIIDLAIEFVAWLSNIFVYWQLNSLVLHCDGTKRNVSVN